MSKPAPSTPCPAPWTCPTCTFNNSSSAFTSSCEVCSTDRPSLQTPSSPPPLPPSSPQKGPQKGCDNLEVWTCSACTFDSNIELALACSVCGTERVSSLALVETLQSEEKQKKAQLILASGECLICGEPSFVSPTYTLRDCPTTCVACEECLQKWVMSRIEERPGVAVPCCFQISSPGICSNTSISQVDIKLLVSPEIFTLHIDKTTEIACSKEGTLHLCPTPDCTFKCEWMSEAENGPPILDCNLCKVSWCLLCRSRKHNGLTCEEYASNALPPNATEEEKRLHLEEIQSKRALSKIRTCKKCGQGVLKKDGCDKIMCLCGYKFCYVCGDEGATCDCTPSEHGFLNPKDGTFVSPTSTSKISKSKTKRKVVMKDGMRVEPTSKLKTKRDVPKKRSAEKEKEEGYVTWEANFLVQPSLRKKRSRGEKEEKDDADDDWDMVDMTDMT
ncbi:hypothetical protein TrVE_jg12229 [Triparma verrucosa]|uniref:RING-type domain-containing protein n=1 Tax=Triparma verrucosa TaxID=1606542 RepID=A0A9W7C934_9STRA|nr:hypothetical protein TrVE_jg12229 [Triparma verrucosa]